MSIIARADWPDPVNGPPSGSLSELSVRRIAQIYRADFGIAQPPWMYLVQIFDSCPIQTCH